MPSYAENIIAYLRPRLSPDQLKLLAFPVRQADSYQWFAAGEEPLVPISALHEAGRDTAQRAFFEVCRRIDELRLALERGPPVADTRATGRRHDRPASDSAIVDGQRYAELLSRLNLTPDQRLVFVQGGVPIRVGWGGELDDQVLFDDPALRPPPPPKPPEAARPLLGRLFARTSSGEVELDDAAAGAVRAEAEARVGRQGVAIQGLNRITLMWDNGCDLDLALTAPDGQRVYFGSKRLEIAGSVAELDVDMNVSDCGSAFDKIAPVENITIDRFAANGVWRVVVTHYKHRFPAPLSCSFRVALQFAAGVRLFEGKLAPGVSRVVASIETRDEEVIAIDGER